ncbi:MAG: alpha/beta fold hydrolase [Puniceicoccales bacterium]|nr:alpha/beta fold hydrolase [Puniceicoccales bacterium]
MPAVVSSGSKRPRFPRKWIYFGVFLLLVIASNVTRHFFPLGRTLGEGQRVVTVRQFVGKDEVAAPAEEAVPMVRVAFRDLRPGGGVDAPVLVLLHGAPGDSSSFDALVGKLAPEFRIIVPDLPGAGASQRDVEDYSAEATAHAMLSVLEGLGVKGAHLLGVGQGGAVALRMAHAAPERVRSLALVSSVGVQEFDLMGNHLVNKIVYGFHMAFIGIAQNVLPHFGLLDYSPVNTAYARLFWDGNLLEVKEQLRGYAGPLFIAHGREDLLVPVEAAEYSARLAPQSRTFFTEGGHRVFLGERVGELAEEWTRFVRDANAGMGGRDATVALEDVPAPPRAEGMRLWVLMLIIIVCAFVAEDPTCLASGLLVAQGVLSFTAATVACLISIVVGDFTLYLIGYVLGRPALRKAPLKWIIAEYEIDRMAGWFEKKGFQGLLLIITSRFIPASRLPTFVCAGVMRLSLWRLGILFFVAAALWTPPLILLAESVGETVIGKFEHWKKSAMWIALGVLFFAWFLFHVLAPALTWRGRRMLVMKVRRWSRHEFWPSWLLYGPVAAVVLWGGLKRFRLGSIAAANPGLGWLGGFTGEAKSETLAAFARAAPGTARVARWRAIPGGVGRGAPSIEERAGLARRFMEENALAYPVALKPDVGDDGLGVNRIANDAQLSEWLGRFKEDALAQEWVEGEEFEVVWCRLPGETRGRVLAVVEKRPVSVAGDGQRTLEELIWADDRTVSRGNLYLRLNWRQAGTVIPAGERVVLGCVGTHRCGAQLVDRQELRTEALAGALDKVADSVGGLHYLVYDLRVADAATLRTGQGWTITGVSGAGTVSSRLHDQYVRLGYAIASARRQVHVALAAADVSRAGGHKPPASLGMLAAWGEARGRQMVDLRN